MLINKKILILKPERDIISLPHTIIEYFESDIFINIFFLLPVCGYYAILVFVKNAGFNMDCIIFIFDYSVW